MTPVDDHIKPVPSYALIRKLDCQEGAYDQILACAFLSNREIKEPPFG